MNIPPDQTASLVHWWTAGCVLLGAAYILNEVYSEEAYKHLVGDRTTEPKLLAYLTSVCVVFGLAIVLGCLFVMVFV